MPAEVTISAPLGGEAGRGIDNSLGHSGSTKISVLALSGATVYPVISAVSLQAHSKIRYALSTAHNFRPMQFLTPITILGGLAHAPVRTAQSQRLARPNDD